jgi:hypothetical protein
MPGSVPAPDAGHAAAAQASQKAPSFPPPKPLPQHLGLTPAPQQVAPLAQRFTPLPMPAPNVERGRSSGRHAVARAGRATGDELVTALFEAMHELHFLRDAIEGAEFCLGLALETLPSRAAIVHLYDIDKREFVVASASGKGTEKLLNKRHPESEPMLASAMRRRRAIVVADASKESDALTERFETLGGAKSLIIAPVMQSGRFLGVIEMINPLDGAPFTENEGAAVSYIAEQYAEFVATRGVVTDAEAISLRQPMQK